MIININNDENRIWIMIENRLIDGDPFHEIFDIHEDLLLYLLPFEFDILLDESREE
jgi:hypothetical protein